MSGMFNSVEIIVDHSVGTRHLFLLSCCFLFFSGFVSIGPVGVPPWWWWSWNTPFVSNGLWHLHKLVIIPVVLVVFWSLLMNFFFWYQAWAFWQCWGQLQLLLLLLSSDVSRRLISMLLSLLFTGVISLPSWFAVQRMLQDRGLSCVFSTESHFPDRFLNACIHAFSFNGLGLYCLDYYYYCKYLVPWGHWGAFVFDFKFGCLSVHIIKDFLWNLPHHSGFCGGWFFPYHWVGGSLLVDV